VSERLIDGPLRIRRKHLAELEALTSQIEPLLARMAATWRAVERELRQQKKGTSSVRSV